MPKGVSVDNTQVIRILAAILLLAVAAPADERARLDRDRAQKEAAASNAQATLRRIDRELADLRQKSATNQTKLRAAELELNKAVAEVTLQQQRVAKVRDEVRRLSGEIDVTGQRLSAGRGYLRTRAKTLWRTSRTSRLEWLITSSDAAELELREHMLLAIAKSDVEHIDRTVRVKNQLEGLKTENEAVLGTLVEEERRLTQAKANVESRRAQLARLQNELGRTTAQKQEARRKTVNMIAQIKRQLDSIQNRLDAISRTRPVPRNFQKPGDGRYFKPDDISLAGIYVVMNHGSAVKAMAEGEVLSIQNMKGMGQTIILGHGGKITSVYANLSAVNVAVGQSINSGGSLGKSGTSPYGDMLYFAVYKDGAAQDPMRYLN